LEYHGSNDEGVLMAVRHMRLMVGIFFLFAGVILLVVRFGFPEAIAKFDPMRFLLGALLALVFGAWNIAKWYMGWQWFQEQATPVRRPLRPDPTTSDEYNPAFDFSKKDEPQDKPAQ
jgi:hypothetical protein